MSKIIKIIDTEHIEIREYKNPNLAFNTNEYDINDKFCILREVINPFIMQQQINQLTNNWNELEEWLQNEYNEWSTVDDEIIRAEARQCIEVLDKMKEIKDDNNEISNFNTILQELRRV